MFVLYALTVEVSFSAIAGAALKHIIRHVSSEMKRSSVQRPNGIVVGIYVALVKKHPIICAIRVHILRARGVYKMLILFVSEEIKVCVEYARKL
jgi:hypothetical protein